jgi:hypothetical protein
MIPLHPKPRVSHDCPACGTPLEVRDWHIPGMRALADLRCPACGKEYYGDLPVGFGLYFPCLLEKQTGRVHDPNREPWHAQWLADSYRGRTSEPVGIRVEQFKPVRRPVLLNTLDHCYGHCFGKILNAQYYLDHEPDVDLVVIVQKAFRWMVPDGVAEIWNVDLPFKRGLEWNDWIAAEIRRRVEAWGTAELSLVLNPNPDEYDIERYTRVPPFRYPEDLEGCAKRPVVTFIWREDRTWPEAESYSLLPWAAIKAWRRGPRWLGGPQRLLVRAQQRRVVALAKRLRRVFPELDFAVAGMGEPGGMPDGIKDLRTTKITLDVERSWCERYSMSHLSIGVHGSNIHLPAAQGSSILELVPADRWRVIQSDLKPPGPVELQRALHRYLFIPLATGTKLLAHITAARLQSLATWHLYWEQQDHKLLRRQPDLLSRRWRHLMTGANGSAGAAAPRAGERVHAPMEGAR